MAGDGVGDVGLLELGDLVLAQRQLLGGERIFEVLDLRGTDDRRRHAGLVQQPRERDLCARNAALGGTQDFEKKLLASLKRNNETLVGQITRARAALYPQGEPQERVLTYASFAIRYGPALLDGLESEVARGFAVS